MTQGKEPGWAPLDAGPLADESGQPFPPGSGGSPWPALPPDAAGAPGPEGLAVVALVLAVVSLLVPVLPGIVALVVAVTAARRVRAAPAGAVAGRGLVAVASALSTIGVLAWVGVGALAVTQRQEPAGWHAATAAAAASADQFSEVTVPPTTEPLPTEPATTEPPTTKPKVAAGRIGDRVTVYDEFGDAQFEVTVTRVRFSTGDELWQPEHGLFMGAYVQVHALADEQDTGSAAEMSALVGGHRYAGDVVSDLRVFDPPLDYVVLDSGERAGGWLVFDVPARHGQLVLRDIMDERQLAVWKY
ncbi:MAG TPA: hypothetical protein VFA46_04265 [Actinomycetes bacterium]|jgi:hypothetical protein|nr:hypothetical protein [Actinomycetes bacterium]